MNSSQMQMPSDESISQLGESLSKIWQSVSSSLTTEDLAQLGSYVQALPTMEANDVDLMETIIAMMPQPILSPALMTQIFSNPET
ncbi:MAG: hypothetical protein JSR46_10150, partial [Verrucomicrobia bacterium]|nr:hypothetical protein [Verrucomicrobiota bacterium]